MHDPQADRLLASIRETPDDDAPRLVYADWLEDHDDAERGQFIRLQCEAARLPEDSDERDGVEDQAAQLFVEHGTRWLGALPAELDNSLTERGFWYRVTRDAATYLKTAGKAPLHRLAPVQTLRLMNIGKRLDKVLAYPALVWVDSLELDDSDVGDDEAARVAASPHLRALRTLILSGQGLTVYGVATLLGADNLPGLRQLRLRMAELGGTGVPTLAKFPGLERLTELEMVGCGIGSGGVADLVRSRYLRQLERLDIGGLNYDDFSLWIDDAALGALGRSRHLPALRDLDLRDTKASPAGWQTFARSPLAGRLRHLDLHHCDPFDEDTVDALFTDGRWTRLESLSFGPVTFSPAALKLLLRSPALQSVRKVDLSNCNLGPEGTRRLAKAPRLENLTELVLHYNNLGDEGAATLAGAKAFPNLRQLQLAGNGIGDEGIRQLAQAPHLTRLSTLGLYNNPLGDEAVAALEGATFVGSLRRLSVGGCNLTGKGIALLASSTHFPRLRHLDLNETSFNAAAVKAMLKPSAFPALEGLTLLPGDFNEKQVTDLRRRFGARLYLMTDADYG